MDTRATRKRPASSPCEELVTKANKLCDPVIGASICKSSNDGSVHTHGTNDDDGHQAGVAPSSQTPDSSSPVVSVLDTQSIHAPRLTLDLSNCHCQLTSEESCQVEQGRSDMYYHWWRDQPQQNSLSLLSVRLIGDSAAPHIHTLIPMHDLAFCR